MMKIKSKNKAFTLIELIIYTTIFALTAGFLTTILITTTRIENVEIVNNQVGKELNFVFETVQRLVRDSSLIECVGNATNITDQSNCSLSTTSGSFLRLRFQDPTGGTKDPKCIYLDNGVIKLAEGEDIGPPVKKQYCNLATATKLTTDNVTASSLNFTKFDIPGGHATVQIEATLAYISSSPELQISKTLRSAVGRVSAATFDSNLLPDANNSKDIGSITGLYKWRNVYIGNILGLGTNTADPDSGKTPGAIYFNTTGNNMKVYNGTSWKSVGLNGTLSSALTGTVSVTIGTAAVTGVGASTLFTSELVVGDSIKIGSEIFTVSVITDNFNLTLDSNHTTGASGLIAYRDPNLFIIDNGDSINKLTITKSGNVGIGTASPNSRLEVNPTVTATTDYTGIKSGLVYNGVTPMANWYGAYITSPTGTGAITNKYALIAEASAGNVGIGTTSPGELLSLGLAGTTKGVLSLAGNALGAGKITIQPAANTGTYALTLPTGTGSLGQFLRTDGAGVTSWATPGGGSKFGGTGTDTALSISSGTTTLDLGGSQFFVKNYTSISITGTGQLAFINPHVNGTVIFLRSQGDVTITSTASPAIELTGIGGNGGPSVAGGVGNNGARGTFIRGATEGYGTGGGSGCCGAVGVGGIINNTEFYSTTSGQLTTRNILIASGSGGGSGAVNGGATSGAGGRGGGSLYIESGGDLNFTGTIWSKGGAGAIGTDFGGGNCGGSGGGGSGGQILMIYNSLTASSGAITTTGGLGGVGTGCAAKGGGGGGSPFANGNGGDASSGGNGGIGGSFIVKNDWF